VADLGAYDENKMPLLANAYKATAQSVLDKRNPINDTLVALLCLKFNIFMSIH
jgi:hypothetical protein